VAPTSEVGARLVMGSLKGSGRERGSGGQR
jgi:hypothetical protein